MKKYTLACIAFLFFSLISAQAPPKLYIQFVSHNEDNFAYLDNVNNYLAARNNLKTVGQSFQSRAVKWNLGSDYILLKAALKYDTNSVLTSTSGKNILKYLKENLGVECDPHSHESRYNYGTIAWLHTQLGITPSDIMSGFLWNTTQNGNWWYNYQNGVQSDSVASYTWQPGTLWGAATPQHTLDPEFWGLWKPKDVAGFTVHTPTNNLILCTQGCKIKVEDTSQVMVIVNQVVNAINKIQNGTAPASGIYNTSIFFGEGKISLLPFRTKLNNIADSLAKYVTQNKLEWRSITEVVNIWKTTYSSQPFTRNCDFSAVVGIKEYTPQTPLNLFPNPVTGILNIQGDQEILRASIYDITGKLISVTKEKHINTALMNKGIYLIEIEDVHGVKYRKRFIKE